MACPQCGSPEATSLGKLGKLFWVRCRQCGTDYELTVTEDEPDLETVQEWLDEGGCMSVTGHWVEPDGYGPDGSPSWLLVLGVI